ncbi:MAG TPA: hypothetical protein VF411_04765 [Bacteroidia bacterium]
MKAKEIFINLLTGVLLCFGSISYAQYSNSDNGIWNSRTYFSGGLCVPMGAFNTDLGATIGYSGDVGTMFFLNKIPMSDNMRIGINVNWLDAEYISIDLPSAFNYGDGYYAAAGVKLGALFSYSPANKMNLDVYFNLNPSYSTSLLPISNDILDGFSLRENIGLNFRYSHLLVGTDFNFGKLKYERYMYNTTNFSSTYFRVRLGFVFNKKSKSNTGGQNNKQPNNYQ